MYLFASDLEGIRSLYLSLYGAGYGEAEALARFAVRVRELTTPRQLPPPNWQPLRTALAVITA